MIDPPGVGAPPLDGGTVKYIRDLATTVDSKGDYFPGHSAGVAHIAGMIMIELGLDQQVIGDLQIAALLHDAGKVFVPDAILLAPRPLFEDEWAVMRQHSTWSAEIAAAIDGLDDVAGWVRHQHEHVDGSGYPDGLRGDDIPWQSRLLLVADAFHVMTAVQPYHAAMSRTEAAAVLRDNAGTQFDAAFVAAFPN